MNRKPTLCLDFDGVLHSYTSGWKGADVIPDPPVAGAIEFIRDALASFQVAIYSSRSSEPGGILAMQDWLVKHGLDGSVFCQIEWPTSKPPAFLTIDDRALTFDGTWPRVADLLAFQPWNKRTTGATGDFPQGRLNKDDQGGLQMAIGTQDGVVVVDFGKPVAWLGLDRATAIALGNNLIKHGRSLPIH